jgi:site-specific DNA-methyltransferase (adenine-specific)
MQQLGFKILNDITWFKRNAAPNLSCRYFTHSTEHIVWAAPSEKSRHTFHYQLMKQINGGKQMRDVWTMSAPAPGEKRHGKHPTQKPLALLDRIIRASTEEGDLVLDPFCGSGTTAVAALGSGRRAIGIDSEAKYLQLAVKRIADVLNQPKLL